MMTVGRECDVCNGSDGCPYGLYRPCGDAGSDAYLYCDSACPYWTAYVHSCQSACMYLCGEAR